MPRSRAVSRCRTRGFGKKQSNHHCGEEFIRLQIGDYFIGSFSLHEAPGIEPPEKSHASDELSFNNFVCILSHA
jgi:hypothetical protein